jgi:hypothetical protein
MKPIIEFLTNLWTARILIIVGFLAGWNSLGATVGHIGNDSFLLVGGIETHSWHHFFRELGGDFGAMAAILLIYFAKAHVRTPVTWWVVLVLMLGFYAPFWAGNPFMSELGAPSMSAEINHLVMAIPALLGCVLSKKHFRENRLTPA